MDAEAAKVCGENKSSTREIVAEKEVGAGLLLPLENAGTAALQRVRAASHWGPGRRPLTTVHQGKPPNHSQEGAVTVIGRCRQK